MTEIQEKKRNPWWLITLACLGITATLLLTFWMSIVEPYRQQAGIVKNLETGCIYMLHETQPPVDSVFSSVLERYFQDDYQCIKSVSLYAKGETPGHGAIPDSALRQLRRLPFLDNATVGQSEPLTFAQLQILLAGRKTTTWKLHAALRLNDEQVRRLPDKLPLASLMLDLTHCPELTETGIAELLDKCPHLELLQISGDEKSPPVLARAVVEAVCRHPELQHLGLSNVAIDPADALLFRSLAHLESLNLSHCPDLADAILDALPGSTTLKYFIHIQSALTGKGVEKLKGHPSLEVLFFNATDLVDADMEHLKGLTALRQLSLDNTRVGDAGLEHLKGLTTLNNLSLKNTPLTDAGLEHVPAMNLRQLSIDGTRVTSAGWETLKDATGMATLEIDSRLLTDEGIEAMKAMGTCILSLHGTGDTALARLAELSRLPSLSFTNRDLSEEDFAHLAALPDLGILNLSGPEITDATIDRLLHSGLKAGTLQLVNTGVTRKCYENYRQTVPGKRLHAGPLGNTESIYIVPMPDGR